MSGPVLAAGRRLPSREFLRKLASMLDDSKKLTQAQRLESFRSPARLVRRDRYSRWASVAEIGRLNILHAAMLAMCRAVARLPTVPGSRTGWTAIFRPALGCPVRCVVGGDGISLSIAAASIVAKVVRDRLMERLGRAATRGISGIRTPATALRPIVKHWIHWAPPAIIAPASAPVAQRLLLFD